MVACITPGVLLVSQVCYPADFWEIVGVALCSCRQCCRHSLAVLAISVTILDVVHIGVVSYTGFRYCSSLIAKSFFYKGCRKCCSERTAEFI